MNDNLDLIRAAKLYKEYREHATLADTLKEESTKILLDYALNSKTDKYRIGGISFSYSGMLQKTWLDEKTIRAKASKELVEEATRKSAPYPSYSVRILKEE